MMIGNWAHQVRPYYGFMVIFGQQIIKDLKPVKMKLGMNFTTFIVIPICIVKITVYYDSPEPRCNGLGFKSLSWCYERK